MKSQQIRVYLFIMKFVNPNERLNISVNEPRSKASRATTLFFNMYYTISRQFSSFPREETTFFFFSVQIENKY